MDNKSPDAFRTISEVAEWLDVPTHVLRFWESRFTQVKPVKRAGGRRYYRPADMELLGGIKRLLHEDGLTIRGVQKLLREEGVAHVATLGHGADGAATDAPIAESPMAVDVPSLPPRGEVVNFVPDTEPAPQFDSLGAPPDRWPFVDDVADEPEDVELPFAADDDAPPPDHEPPAEAPVSAEAPAPDVPAAPQPPNPGSTPHAGESSLSRSESRLMLDRVRAVPAPRLRAEADTLRPVVTRLAALHARLAGSASAPVSD